VLIPWIKDLSQPEVIFTLPFNIPMYGDNFALLPIAMAVLTYFQNKMTIKDPNQKAMIYFMPIFLLALFNSFPAGLVLYWTFSNVMGILQQKFVNKNTSEAANTVPTATQTRGKAKKKK
ncbi:MAG: membrane protein insertase YidC, partial [Chitinivibrionales bacterium]|nr:membrane protein insertase YidC [Chitinivibrionales bacterium]